MIGESKREGEETETEERKEKAEDKARKTLDRAKKLPQREVQKEANQSAFCTEEMEECCPSLRQKT